MIFGTSVSCYDMVQRPKGISPIYLRRVLQGWQERPTSYTADFPSGWPMVILVHYSCNVGRFLPGETLSRYHHHLSLFIYHSNFILEQAFEIILSMSVHKISTCSLPERMEETSKWLTEKANIVTILYIQHNFSTTCNLDCTTFVGKYIFISTCPWPTGSGISHWVALVYSL